MLTNGLVLRDRYRIVCRIGRGGTSDVYLAEDISIGKKWAVKFLECRDDDTGWLAQNEINMMIRLDYEMFPRIVDAWQEEDGYVIVSDYIEGVTLDRVLSERQIGRRLLIDWWIKIAEALEYLHCCRPSILYLDLKLENIMMKKDGSLKLIDFGIAGRIADRGSLYGTPGYAAPEQYYNRGELLDERTDVFAFGMLMYAMLTGRRPVESLKDQKRIISNDKRIPSKIRNIILDCIEEDKEDRYESMAGVRDALEELKGKKSTVFRIRMLAAAAVLAMSVFGFVMVSNVAAESEPDPARVMMEELAGHTKDGEYTDEGIRIISGYIESGCLDDETEAHFIYEVARNYFGVKRNYREALRYFKKLDQQMYPDVSFCIRLCELQLSFEEDNDNYAECLREFTSYNKGLGYDEQRYENDLMIATLYEGLRDADEDDIRAEISCLEDGLSELRFAGEAGSYIDEEGYYEAEYCRRLCMIYAGLKDVKNADKYGETALKLIPASRTDVRRDIKERLESIKNSDAEGENETYNKL